jgi:hypothetical protein
MPLVVNSEDKDVVLDEFAKYVGMPLSASNIHLLIPL